MGLMSGAEDQSETGSYEQEAADNLRALVGEELAIVSFVRDYVEFHFDGPIWTCFSVPQWADSARTLAPSDAGHRDALCALIGSTVTAADVGPKELRVEFDAAVLTVRLDGPTAGFAVASLTPRQDGVPLTERPLYE